MAYDYAIVDITNLAYSHCIPDSLQIGDRDGAIDRVDAPRTAPSLLPLTLVVENTFLTILNLVFTSRMIGFTHFRYRIVFWAVWFTIEL